MSMFSSASLQRHAGATDGLRERVQVSDDDIYGVDLVLSQLGRVARVLPAGQDAAVYHGMQGLDATIEDFGEARQIGDLLDGQAHGLELRGGAAGAHQLVAC